MNRDDMSDNSISSATPINYHSVKQWFVVVLMSVWLIGLTLFFLLRFSFSFYFDNADAIRSFLQLS